jgi:hypothetical protein
MANGTRQSPAISSSRAETFVENKSLAFQHGINGGADFVVIVAY